MAKVVKAAFTDELGDIDDLLPAMPPKKTSTAPPAPAPQTPHAVTTEASHDAIEATGKQGEPTDEARDSQAEGSKREVAAPTDRKSTTRTVKDPSDTPAAPTADISSSNLKSLRALTNSEKARNPITARTYGDVVLDAIEAHEEELMTHWKQPAAQAGATTGLFKRQPVVNKRRRHAEPPAQITLQGLGDENAKALEDLWKDWKAPSRSAFVDQALTLYFAKSKTRRKAAGE